ncbi:hypothetical protein [Candidatus Accumulibacter aalborgensis]|uniref:hypothetical protein n=1 Tax=Candidatus Accumulibacter aalborgensis TaxID=1860102 RepID=UPI001647E8AA|nr:hypothetical protein [Candidatus Accumulibacter aalborgensis]
MRPQRGPDRRQNQLGRPAGLPERRCGADRRSLQLTEESIAAVEARLATLRRGQGDSREDDASGWDKLIIPVR